MTTGNTSSLVAVGERVRDTVADNVLRAIGLGRDRFGSRLFGAEDGERWEWLEYYTDNCDDEAFWHDLATYLTSILGVVGSDAEIRRFATSMEQLVERAGGIDAVRMDIVRRRFRRVMPQVKKAERLAKRPLMIVRPPYPPWDEMTIFADPNEEAPPNGQRLSTDYGHQLSAMGIGVDGRGI